MDKEHSSPREIVDKVREMYEGYPFPTPQRKHSYRQHAAFVRKVLLGQGIDPAGKLFGDIACGTGLMLLDYTREFPQTQFIGYDISSTSVDLANCTLQEEGVENAYCLVQDIMAMPDRERFDYIVSWGTIHHLPDARQGVRLLCRALKPGGILRTGVYGYYGNWERRLAREMVSTLCHNGTGFEEKIQTVREWAPGDKNFQRYYYTQPPVDLNDDDWVVDEFLHVWENHLKLGEVVAWLQEEGMEVFLLTDYCDREIPLDIARHSTSEAFIERVRKLPFAQQCHIIDLVVRPYWLSIFCRKGQS